MFIDRAGQLLDAARKADSDASREIALIVRPDGGLHFIVDSPGWATPGLLAAASAGGEAQSAYRITRSEAGVRVEGWAAGRSCVIEERKPEPVFRGCGQRLYVITAADAGAGDSSF